MLRNGVRLAVALVGLALMVFGGVALAHGALGGLQAVILGILCCGGVIFERAAYKPLERKAPDDRFQRTAERFIDPESGAAVTVYVDPATGERKYVRD